MTDTGSPPAADRPVFVDASGRRRRRVRQLAMVLTAAIGAALTILTAVLLGAPVVPSALLPAPQPPETTAVPTTDHHVLVPPSVTIPYTTSHAPRLALPQVAVATSRVDGATVAPTTRTTTAPVTTTIQVTHGRGRPTVTSTPPGHGDGG